MPSPNTRSERSSMIFFSSIRRHTRYWRDWSSDVCSSDLEVGIPAEVVVTRGDARHLIPFFARKWSSDLIFVRAHVRKDFAHWMLGSVARAVVTTAPCTVQIVREPGEDRAHTLHSGRRVMVATDGSETSAAAVRALAARPWPEGSEFKVVSVEEPWALKPSR